jgi:elongation factor G
VLNSTKGKKERIGRILQMHANHREDHRGGLHRRHRRRGRPQAVTTGDTLCDPTHPIVLEAIVFPEPVIHVAVEPKTKADQDKLGRAVRGSRGGPDLPRAHRRGDRPDRDLGHGRAAPRGARRPDAARVQGRRQRRQARRSPTARPSADRSQGRGAYVRQTGGRGQYGHVVIDLEPTGPGEGFEFVDKITGGVIPKEYIPAVEKGIQEA